MSRCNEDIRIAASSAGVRMWEIAEQLGMADTSLSRKMRNELSEKDKAKCFQIIDELSVRKAESNFRLDFPKWHSASEIPDEFHKENLIDIDGTDISYYVSDWLLAKVKNPMDEKNCYRVVRYHKDNSCFGFENTDGEWEDVVVWTVIPEPLENGT